MAKHAKAGQVIELADKGVSQRGICRALNICHHTVSSVVTRARDLGICWKDVAQLSDLDVAAKLFPEEQPPSSDSGPDLDDIHNELKKNGVTLKLLWEEYVDEQKAKKQPYVSYSTFSRRYSQYVTSRNVTNHLEHKPARDMEVDWSGSTMKTVDPWTGETHKAYLFFATLPYSQYSYVEATPNMKQASWLMAHAHAYEYFGGVAARIVCDNLKTGVITHPSEGDIVLNEAYEELARHFGCAIIPTAVRKPKQKPSVEGSVGKIATVIIAALRNQTFANLFLST